MGIHDRLLFLNAGCFRLLHIHDGIPIHLSQSLSSMPVAQYRLFIVAPAKICEPFYESSLLIALHVIFHQSLSLVPREAKFVDGEAGTHGGT